MRRLKLKTSDYIPEHNNQTMNKITSEIEGAASLPTESKHKNQSPDKWQTKRRKKEEHLKKEG